MRVFKIYFFLISFVVMSQSPGNVSTGLKLWLKADQGVTGTTAVTNWNDQSTNNFNAGVGTSSPELLANDVNFNPSIGFNGVDQSLKIVNGILGTATYNHGFFYVITKVNTLKYNTLFSEFSTSNSDRIVLNLPFSIDLASSNNHVIYNFGDCCTTGRISHGTAPTLGDYHLWTFGSSTSMATPSGTRKSIYRDGSLIVSNNNSDTVTSNDDDFVIGDAEKGSTTNRFYAGNIAELIVYTSVPSATDKQKIESYLASKYGITLTTSTDYVASDGTTFWDATANSDYHQEIGVIGRDDLSGLNQKQSKSKSPNSILTVALGNAIEPTNIANTNTFTDDYDFLAWGNKSTSNTFGVESGVTILKVNRDWKVQNTGVDQTLTLQFDMTGIAQASTYRLLIDADGDYMTTGDQTISCFGTLTGNDLTFTNVSLNNNDVFTLINRPYEITYNGSWTGGSGTGGVPTIADGSKRIDIQASVTVPENFVCTCLKVNSGQVLTVPTNTYINADELSLEGDIYLEGTSELIQTTAGINTNTGSRSIYKVLGDNTVSSTHAYNYLSSPVNTSGSFTVNGNLKFNNTATDLNDNTNITFTTNREALANEISTRWLHTLKGVAFDRINQTTTLSPGVGFTIKGNGTRTLNQYNFIGLPNNGNITVPILNTEYVLTGNPYPSSIDIDAFNANMSTSLSSGSKITSGTVYLWDHDDDEDTHEVASYNASYATRAGGVSAPATWTGIGVDAPKTPDQYIRPGQGFIVAGQDVDGDLLFTNALRGNTGLGTHQFLKTASLPKPIIRLGFEYTKDAKTHHRQLVAVPQGGSMEMETGYDAPMFEYLPNDAYWGVNNQDARFVISKVPYVHDDLELPIGVVLDDDKSVTFTLDDVENLSDDIYLLDKEANTITDLRANNYQTTAYSGDDKDRFSLVFKAQESLSNKSLASQLKSVVYVQNKQLNVAISGGLIDQVVVYDVSGKAQVSYQNTSSSSHTSVAVPTLSNQLYLVKVVTDKGAFTKKLLIE